MKTANETSQHRIIINIIRKSPSLIEVLSGLLEGFSFLEMRMPENVKEAIVESKTKQLIKIAERLPYLPDLSFRTGNYRKAYRLGKKFYRGQWRGKEKPSKVFGGEKVYATSKGFRHLISKTVKTTYADAMKRLKHLPNAKQIIEKADFIYKTTKEVEKTGRLINRHVLLGKLENCQVLKVVVKEIGGRFSFGTVYVTKIKVDGKETQAVKPVIGLDTS